jgi:hypothetical protein
LVECEQLISTYLWSDDKSFRCKSCAVSIIDFLPPPHGTTSVQTKVKQAVVWSYRNSVPVPIDNRYAIRHFGSSWRTHPLGLLLGIRLLILVIIAEQDG